VGNTLYMRSGATSRSLSRLRLDNVVTLIGDADRHLRWIDHRLAEPFSDDFLQALSDPFG